MALEHWVWLSNLDISRRAMLQLLDRFGDPQRVYEASPEDICALRLEQSAEALLTQPHDLRTARVILSTCAKKNISIVTMQDAAYPNRLRNIEVPPVLLYVGGHMPSFDEEAAIAVVGTRNCSDTARSIAARFGYELADKGMLVVSGMAKGIDAAANRGALEAGKRTVAVLGCGIDVCYPSDNRPLYDRILSGNGCLISEYPPGTRPIGSHFPERNRIISGLSAGVLVVAAPSHSGSLITASQALEQGREIFVVPGGVTDPEFVGSNSLIKQGAIPVTTPKDIIAYYYARFPDAFDAREISRYMNPVSRERTSGRSYAAENEGRRRTEPASVPVVRSVAPAMKTPAAETAEPERKNAAQAIMSGLKSVLQSSKKYDTSIFTEFGKTSVRSRRTVSDSMTDDSINKKSARKTAESPRTEPEPVSVLPESRVQAAALPEEQQKLMELLQGSPEETAHIDQLVNQSGFSASDVLVHLTELELEGLIEALPGKRFHIV